MRTWVSVRGWVHSPPSWGSTTARRASRSRLGDLPVPALVQVDGAGVDLAGGPARVDGADQLVVGRTTMRTSEAKPLRRPTPWAGQPEPAPHRGRPRPGLGPEPELVVEHQAADAVVEQVAPPALVVEGQRALVGRAGQVGEQDVGVGRVDDGGLGRPGEDLLGVGHEPLVELVVAGHEHGDGLLALAPGPPRLLPERGDRAREAVEDAGVEPADVDAQLEGGGGDDGPQPAGEQLGLDLAALGGQVAAPVGGARRPAAPAGRRRWTSAATTSAPRRLRQKAMVRCPSRTRRATRSAVSWLVDRLGPSAPGRRRARCRRRRSGRGRPRSSTAGFHRATSRSPLGEASSVTSATGRPHSSEASRPGWPMVAEQKTKVGSEP